MSKDSSLGAGLTRARAVMIRPRAKLDTLGKPLPGDTRAGSMKGMRAEALRTTTVLKDAILYAAQLVGEDGKGKHGLVGYLVNIARHDPKTFAALLARVIPLTVTSHKTTEVTYRSVEEVTADLEARGIFVDRIYH